MASKTLRRRDMILQVVQERGGVPRLATTRVAPVVRPELSWSDAG